MGYQFAIIRFVTVFLGVAEIIGRQVLVGCLLSFLSFVVRQLAIPATGSPRNRQISRKARNGTFWGGRLTSIILSERGTGA